MSDLIDKVIQVINQFVSKWTNKYLYTTVYEEEIDSGHRFLTKFSLPTPQKPIPVAVVKVYFYISDLTDPSEEKMQFRFENDSLIHSIDRTIRLNQMQKWLEQILQRKHQTSKILFLGTEFEETRIRDVCQIYCIIQIKKIQQRMLDLLAEAYVEPSQEKIFLQPHLLESESEIHNLSVFDQDQNDREMRLLRETLYQFYRQIDVEDLGMLSNEECLKVFQLMGINLSQQQGEEVCQQLDITKTGIIDYKDLVGLGAELIHTIFCKNLAQKDLQSKEEENFFEANMMLLTDRIHDINQKVIELCQNKDEDGENEVDYERFQEVLKEIGDVLDEQEQQIIIKEIKKQYPQMIKYKSIGKIFYDQIYAKLLKGLDEENKNKLQLYLIKLFAQSDQNLNGTIHIEELILQLRISDQLMLSKIQLMIIQNFIKQDESGYVKYKQESKFLSQLIKKFFNADLLLQRNLFVQNAFIGPEQYIEPKDIYQIRKQIDGIKQ